MMQKIYLVLREKNGILELVDEFYDIKDCYPYLEDKDCRIVESYKKPSNFIKQ